MGPARSTFYDQPKPQAVDEARLIERIAEICAEWPAYGYRRRHRRTARRRPHRQPQEGDADHEGKRALRAPAPTPRGDDGQRSRRSDLPQPCQEREPERPRPALGRRHHLHRRAPASYISPSLSMPGLAGLSVTRSAGASTHVLPSQHCEQRSRLAHRQQAASIIRIAPAVR